MGPEMIASLIVSSIGFVAFSYGKRQIRIPQVVTGLVLMVFPYAVSDVPLIAAIAGALLAAMWIAIRLGA